MQLQMQMQMQMHMHMQIQMQMQMKCECKFTANAKNAPEKKETKKRGSPQGHYKPQTNQTQTSKKGGIKALNNPDDAQQLTLLHKAESFPWLLVCVLNNRSNPINLTHLGLLHRLVFHQSLSSIRSVVQMQLRMQIQSQKTNAKREALNRVTTSHRQTKPKRVRKTNQTVQQPRRFPAANSPP